MKTSKINWLIWLVAFPLTITASVFVGVILGEKTQKASHTPLSTGDQPAKVSTEIEPTPEADPSQLILGKWQYAGNSEWTDNDVPKLFQHTITYFEDGSYQEYRDGDPPMTYPETTNGSYIVLSDGQLKKTFESCKTLPCREIVHVNPISFPDPNTYLQHYQYKEEKRHSIYKRENQPQNLES